MAGKRAAKRNGADGKPGTVLSQAPATGTAADPAVLELPADCRMAASAALKASLQATLETGAVELDGRAVERVDTAALQLLVLFRRELETRGGRLRWRSASEALHEAANLLGLAQTLELPAAELA